MRLQPQRRARIAGAAIVLLTASPASLAVDIKLNSMWMRPAAAGSTTKAYVDIVSDTKLALVGAKTPRAKKVEFVVVEKFDGVDPGKVVKTLPIASDKPTRLAYLGNHLRLVDVKEELTTGKTVPVDLDFKDAKGTHYHATAAIVVHGLMLGPAPGARAEPRRDKALETIEKPPRAETMDAPDKAPDSPDQSGHM